MTNYDYSDVDAREYDFAVRDGKIVTDEMLFKAIGYFCGPSFDPVLKAALLREFDVTKHRSRGRPKGNISARSRLISQIGKLPASTIPPSLKSAVLKRLHSGKRCSDLPRQISFNRMINRRHRDAAIRGLYRDFYAMLKVGPPYHHEIIGQIDVSAGSGASALSEKALLVVSDVMLNRLEMPPPSIATMRNVVSRKYFKLRE